MPEESIQKLEKFKTVPTELKHRIKLLYMSEKPLHMIESLTGVPVRTIAGMSKSLGWIDERRKRRAELALANETEIQLFQDRRKRWVKNQDTRIEKYIQEAEKMTDVAISSGDPRVFKAAVDAWDKIDVMYRRNSGLDKAKVSVNAQVSVNLTPNKNFDPTLNAIKKADAVDIETEELN